MKSLLLTGFILSIFNFTYAREVNSDYENCTSSKEFITTYNYLVSKKEFALNQKDIYKLSLDVAAGCNFAADRFIKSLDLMLSINLATSDAITIAKKVALSDDKKSDAFRSVLKKSFAKIFLDLPLDDSIKYALDLSINYDGDPSIAHSDFVKLVDFCKSEKHIELPLNQCAKMAINVSKMTSKYNRSLAEAFINLYEFMTDKDGPNLSTFEAIKIANEITPNGPLVYRNFKLAFEYAIGSNPGLGLNRGAAIDFARKLATQSARKTTELKK